MDYSADFNTGGCGGGDDSEDEAEQIVPYLYDDRNFYSILIEIQKILLLKIITLKVFM